MNITYPVFVSASVEITKIGRSNFINKPVNLAFCKTFYKSRYSPSSTTGSYTSQPSIVFDGVGVTWVFITEEERDSEFQRILNGNYTSDKL